MRTLILLTILLIFMVPPTNYPSGPDSYIMVGGQSGTWFREGQNPRLYKVFLSNYSEIQLRPVPSEGTVWTGGWNGSQWLISGWGTQPGIHGSNPYIYLYDGETQVEAGSLSQYESESSWHGGDIFAASYNGKYWLLSGMGSDTLPGLDTGEPVNHMSLATFDGYNFIDLSGKVPRQQDGILYANAWNGTHWLVGGGYADSGVLFSFDGATIVDLTDRISSTVRSFASVQSIAWNGKYWLIGGIGFLARYDGYKFVDLTLQLRSSLHAHLVNVASIVDALASTGWGARHSSQLTVNAIVWNGSSWMLGGGSPVAQPTPNVAWLASYGANGFIDLSSSLPAYVSQPEQTGSSILSICHTESNWIFGGYSDDRAILFSYDNGSFVDMSHLVSKMSYVIWVGSETNHLSDTGRDHSG
jgi:hypothetical protein